MLWDVGGRVGLAGDRGGRLVPGLRVYAVERSATQIGMLRANVARHGERAGEIVEGEAPDVWPTSLLRTPSSSAAAADASSRSWTSRSRASSARGRIVANLVTYENVATVLAWARGHAQAGGRPAQRRPRRRHPGHDPLQAENPVTVVTVRRLTTERGAGLSASASGRAIRSC